MSDQTAPYKKTIAKYRPSLTAPQIAHIVSLCKLDMSMDSISVIKTLAPLEAKIANNAIEPSFTTSPTLSIEDRLGMESGKPPSSPHIATTQPDPSYDKVAHNLACYTKYKLALATDNLETLPLTMILAAKEHMYVNDLMSPEEEAEYEAGS